MFRTSKEVNRPLNLQKMVISQKEMTKEVTRVGVEPTILSSVHQVPTKVPPKDALHLVCGDAIPLGHLAD